MALEAAESLQQEGISCRVLDMFSIKPIDNEILEKAARETGCIVTTEEHNIIGGMGSAVAESFLIHMLYPLRGLEPKTCLENLQEIMKFLYS